MIPFFVLVYISIMMYLIITNIKPPNKIIFRNNLKKNNKKIAS